MKPILYLVAASLVIATPVVSHADALPTVAKKLSKGLATLKTKRIAVLPFAYPNGDESSGSTMISERLTTLLVERGGVEVVERTLLEKTMSEIKLGMTGILDSATTQKLGKILGAAAIVTGTLIDLEEQQTEVNARMIDTETGSILSAASARVKRNWHDLPRPPRRATSGASHEESGLHMSRLIPTTSPKPHTPPAYTGPVQALPPADGTEGDILTLTPNDLVPLSHRGQTDPERLLNDFISSNSAPPNAVSMARRIYHRSPDPKIRARALMAMGHLLERQGDAHGAARVYSQVLTEFPDHAALQTEARHRLDVVTR